MPPRRSSWRLPGRWCWAGSGSTPSGARQPGGGHAAPSGTAEVERPLPIVPSVRVGILGAAEARSGREPVDLGTRKQRALLAALALHDGRPVHPDTLVDLIWGDEPPAAVTPTLHGYVAKLRRALEPTGRHARRRRCWCWRTRATSCGWRTTRSMPPASNERCG